MKSPLFLFLFAAAGVLVSAQVASVGLTPSSTAYAVVPVCASAISCGTGINIGQIKATVNTSNASSWRLAYNGATATALFQSNGFTYTVYGLYVDTSQDNCVAWAAANGITIPASVLNPQ